MSVDGGSHRRVAVRLAGDGILQADIGDGYGPVCNDGFGSGEADTFCQAMGYTSHSSYDDTDGHTDDFVLDDVSCSGSECSASSSHDCVYFEAVELHCASGRRQLGSNVTAPTNASASGNATADTVNGTDTVGTINTTVNDTVDRAAVNIVDAMMNSTVGQPRSNATRDSAEVGLTGAASCGACPVGQYNLEGQLSCINCDAGRFSPTSGSSSCRDCPAGLVSDTAAGLVRSIVFSVGLLWC